MMDYCPEHKKHIKQENLYQIHPLKIQKLITSYCHKSKNLRIIKLIAHLSYTKAVNTIKISVTTCMMRMDNLFRWLFYFILKIIQFLELIARICPTKLYKMGISLKLYYSMALKKQFSVEILIITTINQYFLLRIN